MLSKFLINDLKDNYFVKKTVVKFDIKLFECKEIFLDLLKIFFYVF